MKYQSFELEFYDFICQYYLDLWKAEKEARK